MDTNDVDDYDSEGVTQASSTQRYTKDIIRLIAIARFRFVQKPKDVSIISIGHPRKRWEKESVFQEARCVYGL